MSAGPEGGQCGGRLGDQNHPNGDNTGVGEGVVADVKGVGDVDGIEEGMGVVAEKLDLLDELDELGGGDVGVAKDI